MDFLLIAVALLVLILAKSILAGKERDFRNKRAQRKMRSMLEDAQRDGVSGASQNPDMKSRGKAKPPPLPGKDSG